jgi:UDP-N-acetylmuramoyl-L-alanyl-D-glutamate--2,6-diaminopimelate ligase
MQANYLESEIAGLFFDTQKVIKDSVFFAIQGVKSDGHEYISQAIEKGAIALVVESELKVPESFSGMVYIVPSSREALDLLAARFFEYPSDKLFCIGVTGTNGKTSITYILEHILNQNKKLTGVMGTVNHRIGDRVWDSQMTTPDPVILQSRLQDFVKEQAFAAAMEISSHALEQKRANSVHFNTVIFTNLTLDHLDYHHTMQNYFAAKQKLFTDLMWLSTKRPLFAVVNVDDKYGRMLKTAEPVIVWTYGQVGYSDEADFYFKIKKMDFNETIFDLTTPLETKEVKILIPGVHTVYNVVACLVTALTCGLSLNQAVEALLTFQGIPGRLQKVITNRSQKTVFVDYAHTPDALENSLRSLRKIQEESKSKGKLICIFGCGGDRDKTKRSEMAKMACAQSDYVIITSDNPRTEVPAQIIKDIEAGVPLDYKNIKSEVDREQAIKQAIEMATDDDVILIAGKGHEDYQIIGTEKIHFNDLEVAYKYLTK